MFQVNTLALGDNRQRASVRMSQYLQSWRNIHPFADLSNPNSAASKKPIMPTNSALSQSHMPTVRRLC